MSSARRRRVASLIVACVTAGLTGPAGIAQDQQKSVMSLYAARSDSPAAAAGDPILQRVLGNGLAGYLDYYQEYMDLARFPDPGHQESVRDFLLSKYKGRRFDLIIANSDATLDFLKQYRNVLFAGTPVVFNATDGSTTLPNATGLISRLNFRDTLDTAVRIQADRTHVVVVSGASAFDKYYETVARDQFKELEGRLEFTYLSGLPIRELLRRVAILPAHSIVFFTSLDEDGDGHKFQSLEMLDRLSAVSNVPVYSWLTVGMNHGIVGGRMLSIDLLANRLAELALRVLGGARPETIPVTEIDWSVTEFDWRQLQRWGISESLLPEGSTVLYKQPGVWVQYRPYLLGFSLLLMLQTALIGALLVQRTRRKRAEQAVRESEERFRLMADTAPVLVWRSGPDKLCDFLNRPWLEFTGRTVEQELGNGWSEGVWPDDLDRCVSTYVSAFDARQPFQLEYRLRRADGVYRWVLDTGVPRYGPDGSFVGYIGSCLDINDRKDSEDALRESQQRYAMATTAGALGVWDWNLETNELYVDPTLKSLLGFEDAEITTRPDDWGSRVHPQDAPAATAQVKACIDGETDVYAVEHRMLHKDGSAKWFLSRGSAKRGVDGTLRRLVGTKVDITERKLAEQAILENEAALQASNREIRHLAGSLISAQDSERARIARDLHDDVSQQLAALSIALSVLKRRVAAIPSRTDLQDDVSSLQRRTSTLAESIRDISHDLHPDVLRHAGLDAALTAYCNGLSLSRALAVTCSAQGDFGSLDPAAALCLYRVAQEALQNVVKHAEARQAEVRLLRTGESAELTIADDGKGFDIQTSRSGTGLGLVSMTERARLAGGTVSIVTALDKGTQIRVQIPIDARTMTEAGQVSGRFAASV